MLEQAADPIHQLRSGQTPGIARQFTKVAQEMRENQQSSSSTPMKSNDEVKEIPNTVTLFKPEIDQELKSLLSHCEEKLKINEKNLLSEVKEYLQQVEVTWSISANHVKCLFEIYYNHITDPVQQVTVLKMFQKVSLDRSVAGLIAQNSLFIDQFLPGIKQAAVSEIKFNSLQMVDLNKFQNFYFILKFFFFNFD